MKGSTKQLLSLLDSETTDVSSLVTNPLDEKAKLPVPVEVAQQGRQAVRSWILKQTKAPKASSIKLIVLGHGRAGKTSLLRMFESNQNVTNDCASTIGVDVRDTTRNGMQVNILDFAGQPEYQQIHHVRTCYSSSIW